MKKIFSLVLVGLLMVGSVFAAPMFAKSEIIIENKGYNTPEEVTKMIDLYKNDYKETSFDEWTAAFDEFNDVNRCWPMWFINNENETSIYEARWTNQYILIKVIWIRDVNKHNKKILGE